MRKLFFWKLKRRELQLGDRTLLMAVLNITPDSFSDGGKFLDADRAFARAMELEEQGADILDIGAESTHPGSARITAAVEMQRLIPVLKRLRDHLAIPISVDTYKAEVAERALELGVEIINDPSGLTFEPNLARVVSNNDAGLVLNHMRGRPETWEKLAPMPDPMGTIGRDLEAAVGARAARGHRQVAAGGRSGSGFRETPRTEYLHPGAPAGIGGLDLPLLTGPSRKHFWLTRRRKRRALPRRRQ